MTIAASPFCVRRAVGRGRLSGVVVGLLGGLRLCRPGWAPEVLPADPSERVPAGTPPGSVKSAGTGWPLLCGARLGCFNLLFAACFVLAAC